MDKINVTRSSMPDFEEYCREIREDAKRLHSILMMLDLSVQTANTPSTQDRFLENQFQYVPQALEDRPLQLHWKNFPQLA